MHYHGIDEERTISKTNKLLLSYRDLNIELHKLRITTSVSAVQYDGMPKSVTNVNTAENALIDELQSLEERKATINLRISMIKQTILGMQDIDYKTERLAKLLKYYYIKRYSINKCCFELTNVFIDDPEENENDPLSRSSFYRYRKQGLLSFALLYPVSNDVLVKN